MIILTRKELTELQVFLLLSEEFAGEELARWQILELKRVRAKIKTALCKKGIQSFELVPLKQDTLFDFPELKSQSVEG